MLVLYDLSSTMHDPLQDWSPAIEDTFVTVDLTIGWSDGEQGADLFFVAVATPEALRKRAKEFLISDHRVLIIDRFDYASSWSAISKILDESSRPTWDDSCAVLQRYFYWEYEDYIPG